MVSARFLCVAIQTSIHCILFRSSTSLLVKEVFHHSVFVITYMTFVTGFVLLHVANVLTRCVTWKDCNHTSCQSGVSHISWCDLFFFAMKAVVFLLIVHETANLPVSSCFICQLMDSLIFHFTTVDRQTSFIFSITLFVNRINHSLMLSCNFTLHSCSYRRPSICN